MSAENAGPSGVVFRPKQSRFRTIPQSPLCYWLRERFFDLLAGSALGDVADACQGLATANDPRFARFVWQLHRRAPLAASANSTMTAHTGHSCRFSQQASREGRG